MNDRKIVHPGRAERLKSGSVRMGFKHCIIILVNSKINFKISQIFTRRPTFRFFTCSVLAFLATENCFTEGKIEH